MKNITKLTLILCFTLMSYNTINAQPVRRVLFEFMTAYNCEECGLYGNQLMKEIINNNPDKVIGITIHREGILSNPVSKEISQICHCNIPCAAANRINNIGMFAGNIFVEKENWDTIVNAALLQQAKVDVKLLYSIDKESRMLNAVIEATFYEAMSGNFRLNIIITEDDLISPQSGAEEDYHHNNVLRDMLGGAWGIEGTIPSEISAGQSFTYKTNYTIDTSWNIDKLHFIGILQEVGIIESGLYVIDLQKLRILNSAFGSETTNIDDFTKLENKFLITPNPVKNQIIMNFYSDAMQVSCPLVIYNLLGIKQKEINAKLQNGENTIPIDLSGFSSGVYFVVINDGNSVRKKMFVKE